MLIWFPLNCILCKKFSLLYKLVDFFPCVSSVCDGMNFLTKRNEFSLFYIAVKYVKKHCKY